MLLELRVKNLGIIENISWSLGSGGAQVDGDERQDGGGGPQLLKQGIRANYDINKLVERAKKIAGISK